ncbi:cupin domain-containing protein [Streptomyces sp. C10-9-1]|uniref:XRE family transcriptional regulator n=1 Tax=Streptomyces sanyensis TaxID=568869 RepID=A0ABP9B5N4_9ACTN|nr:cupin domain-containing protein [Streptomyces sp. C10-9-1]MCQ6554220.1 cupin domain-containing protein [Streptomyces sp. C10-9-1]
MDDKDGKDTKEREEPLRVGAAVRKRRRVLRLTLAAVSARSGLSVPFLSQIENERARPSDRSLQRVAAALDTTVAVLLAASDTTRTVDLVRAPDDAHPGGPAGVRSLVRGRHQLNAVEYTGDHQSEGEFQHRNDELLYVADGAAEVEAEGRAYRLGPGDTLFLSGGVRHRWRATTADTRILVVAVAGHLAAAPAPRT